MQVSDCMRTTVYTVNAGATLRRVMQLMGTYMVGTLPVVDDEQHVLGVVMMDDILTLFMPQFVEILRQVDFVHDYGFLEAGRKAAHLADKPVTEIMRPPFMIHASSGLMEVMVYMHKHEVNDVPVVDAENRLVGLVSRVRVGSLFLSDWLSQFPD
jgi:CBS domain-containing protein